MIRALLLAVALLGVGRLMFAEWHYARGMAAVDVQTSIEHLTRAGEVYPGSYTFRTAQAKQLFNAYMRHVPWIAPAAGESLRRAIAVDPRSVELVSMLLAVQRREGHCDDGEITAARLLRLAPRSERAKSVASMPCKG